MQNPFKKDGEMLPVASINSVYVDNKTAYELFRPSLILEDFRNCLQEYDITELTDSTSVVNHFNVFINHPNPAINLRAIETAKRYGNQLGKILSTLFNPSELSKINRKNWTQIHWDYWNHIEEIIFVGGLTSPQLTTIFKSQIQQVFSTNNIINKRIEFVDGSQNMGASGLASIVTDGEVILFDFGQTSIKRGYVHKDSKSIVKEVYLEPIESKYLFYKDTTQEDLFHLAKQLDDYIVSIILQTSEETQFKGNIIYVSIANYVYKGEIYPSRGGYGKLALLAKNYQNHLQDRLRNVLHKEIKVTLFHDTSSMALHFRNKRNTAVISLGTAFGVAFPDDSLYS